MSLSDDIKSLGYESGFHAVGITGADPFDLSYEAIVDRLDKGLLEGTGYTRDIAHLYTHPAESLPSARSIIPVALSYLTEDMELSSQGDGPRGWIARFSRGLDYHEEIDKRLSVFADSIHSKLGICAEIRSFADTGTIADRSAAIRAGIGSRGKNTCIYAGEYRSWVILGELITDIELQPDNPAALDICGECDKCMKACPTGAICAPYVVNTGICLSQVTQSKGFIPHWLRKKMGNRIYGCDTCQSACPLNKDAIPGNIDWFRPSSGLGKDPELLPLLNMNAAEFRSRVVPTTAGWIRRNRIRRNTAIALGNIADPVAVPELTEALADAEPVIRGHAAWALGEIGTPQARYSLESAFSKEIDPIVADEIRNALNSGG